LFCIPGGVAELLDLHPPEGLFQKSRVLWVFLKQQRAAVSHESLKILFNNCFVFLEDDLVETP
jgi:hypothetical protein